MPYGHLNHQMREALTPLVKGRVVYDLGAGDGDHGRTLSNLGAARVVCIDKEQVGFNATGSLPPRPPVKNIEVIRGYIAEVPIPTDLDVVFLGWPQNYHIIGLVPWMQAAKTVIYLGHNFGGTACGFPAMFEHLIARRLVAHIPNERNTLLVVGEPLLSSRAPTPEEAAFFSSEVVSWG